MPPLVQKVPGDPWGGGSDRSRPAAPSAQAGAGRRDLGNRLKAEQEAGGSWHSNGAPAGGRRSQMDPKAFFSRCRAHRQRTQRVPCHEDLQEMAPAKKQILCSKSFGTPVTDLDSMLSAVSTMRPEPPKSSAEKIGNVATWQRLCRPVGTGRASIMRTRRALLCRIQPRTPARSADKL